MSAPRPPRWTAGDPIPKVLTDTDLMGVLGLGHSQFYKRKALGHFTDWEVTPQLPDSATRYSGRKVADWTDMREPAPRAFQAHVRYQTRRTRPGRPRGQAPSPEVSR